MYLMSQRNFQILKKFFDENLANSFIKASFFPTTVTVLFVKKLRKKFRLYINLKFSTRQRSKTKNYCY